MSCPNCGSKKDYTETIYVEHCTACGYGVRYDGEGCNEVAKNYFMNRREDDPEDDDGWLG